MARHRTAPSQRQLRVGELIRRAVSDVLMRGETHDPDLEGVSITVTEVRPAPDLRQAVVYVLPLGGEGGEEVVAALTKARGALRRAVNARVDLKFSPELSFVLDDSFDKMDETRRMLAVDRVRRDLDGES